MTREGAVVLIPAGTLVLVRRARLFLRRRPEESVAIDVGAAGPPVWMEPSYVDFLRDVSPSVVSAVFLATGIGAVALDRFLWAGVLFALGMGLAAWRWPLTIRAGRTGEWTLEVVCVAVVVLLIGADRGARQRPNGQVASLQRAPITTDPASPTGGGLSGVILTLPTKPHDTPLRPPPLRQGELHGRAAHPVRLDFDGVYWYFQAPDLGPRRDAKVVTGDPTRARIRSTDFIPLQMEAHQRLPPATTFERYRQITVRMGDADTVPGLIRVSLLLRTEDGAPPLLLGTRVLEASRTQHGYANRPIIEEDLRYALTAVAQGRSWTELVVRVEPERDRAQAGAHVMVKSFLLEP